MGSERRRSPECAPTGEMRRLLMDRSDECAIKVTLCPLCTECPEVEITDQGVTIGEDANTVRLSHAEWNELVRLVKADELREV